MEARRTGTVRARRTRPPSGRPTAGLSTPTRRSRQPQNVASAQPPPGRDAAGPPVGGGNRLGRVAPGEGTSSPPRTEVSRRKAALGPGPPPTDNALGRRVPRRLVARTNAACRVRLRIAL